MADVTILLDNADGLLPVDYQVLELGRRLYRSGENDYLLNRQRVRLRTSSTCSTERTSPTTRSCSSARAWSIRRSPCGPRSAGRCSRRSPGSGGTSDDAARRRSNWPRSEANLARVEDIVAELRPQARRLAAQAEQQATRVGAGDELAAALLLAAHARWFEASARAGAAADRRAMAQAEADTAMQELQTAEEAASGLAQELGARSVVETERRATLDAAQAAVNALRLREERAAADLEGIARDRTRLHDERAVAEASLVVQRRALSQPIPARDVDLDGELSEAERALSDALAELASLRAERRARGEDLAAIRRAEAVRQAELETARRRLADVERRATEAAVQVDAAGEHRATVEAALASAQEALAEATEAERRASVAREAARAAADEADGTSRAAAERSVAAASALAELRGRLDALLARQADEEARGIAKAARRVGGRRLDEDLVVDPALRAAVEAALGEAARGYLVDAAAVPGLATERGVVVTDRTDEAGARRQAGALADATIRERVVERGGGVLAEAVRRDSHGAARRLLGRAVWLPDLDACLAIQPDLPPGWVAVPRDGAAVVTDRTVRLGSAEGPPGAARGGRAADRGRGPPRGRGGSDPGGCRRGGRERRDLRPGEAERRRDEEAEAAAARRRAEDAERIAVPGSRSETSRERLAPGAGRATRRGGRQGTRRARGP